jgi:hypothetical protein
MRLIVHLLATTCLLCFQACNHKTTQQVGGNEGNQAVKPQGAEKAKNIAKVKVDQRGQIFLNERLVSLDELRKAFYDLKQLNGSVWYHRENPEGEPTPEAMSVIKAVIDAQLPIRLSSKPDYSDVVGPQ